ncbi:MAG: LysR substrate-binding domain-containing protein, partial [Rhodanobacter sp.]
EFGRHPQIVVTDNQPGAEKTQHGVAGKRQWLVNDLGAKRDLLKAGLGWGHLPRHLVDEDLASGQLVELERRAWHMGPLTFVISRRRGHDLSACEERLVELLGEGWFRVRRIPHEAALPDAGVHQGKERRKVRGCP